MEPVLRDLRRGLCCRAAAPSPDSLASLAAAEIFCSCEEALATEPATGNLRDVWRRHIVIFHKVKTFTTNDERWNAFIGFLESRLDTVKGRLRVWSAPGYVPPSGPVRRDVFSFWTRPDDEAL